MTRILTRFRPPLIKMSVWLQLGVIAVSLSHGPTGLGALQKQNTDARQSRESTELVNYPGAIPMHEANLRLNEKRAPSWLEAQTYHTDDSIDSVIKHFEPQTTRFKAANTPSGMALSLMHNNWNVRRLPLGVSPTIFDVGEDLKKLKADKLIATTLGVIPLRDSVVRVHLISPHPKSANNNELTSGTMIVIVREQLSESGVPSVDTDDAVYTGREVTRTVWIKSKPEPPHPGGRRHLVLKAVFSSTGEVTKIRIVDGVFDEFTRVVIESARKIKFEPAIKDGHYVSMWIQLEYNFR